MRQSVWIPQQGVIRHMGGSIPKDMKFFALPPPEIGQVISAESTLKTSTLKGLTLPQIIIGLLAGLIGAGLGWLLAFIYRMPEAETQALTGFLGIIFIIITYWTQLSHRCSYVGENGIAIHTLNGTRNGRPKTEILCFQDATNLYTSQTAYYVNRVYLGTFYNYRWEKKSGPAYKLSGSYRSESNWLQTWLQPLKTRLESLKLIQSFKNARPQEQDKWHFAIAAEAAWSRYMLPILDRHLDRAGYVEFPMRGNPQAVRVGSGFTEFVMKGGMSQRVQVVDMREITLGNGVFQFKHKDAQWWSGKGKYTFTYKNIPNANLFLIYLDRLTGIRWEQDISEPEEVHHHPGIRGDDLRLDVTLGFREAIFGCKKEVRIQHLELTFNGNLEPNIKKLTITIPSGVDDGTRLRITGEGDAGQSGGESGDLYIYLTASREEGPFRREGIDIVSTLTMTIEQAQQGGTMWVNTIDGEATIVIPAGTKRGDRLRVPGRGVPKLGSPDERGDHIVCVDF